MLVSDVTLATPSVKWKYKSNQQKYQLLCCTLVKYSIEIQYIRTYNYYIMLRKEFIIYMLINIYCERDCQVFICIPIDDLRPWNLHTNLDHKLSTFIIIITIYYLYCPGIIRVYSYITSFNAAEVYGKKCVLILQ